MMNKLLINAKYIRHTHTKLCHTSKKKLKKLTILFFYFTHYVAKKRLMNKLPFTEK